MKSIIIYYSFTGNTKKAALILSDVLSKQGTVDIFGIKAPRQSTNFFEQGRSAFMRQRTEIEGVPFDLSGYDLIAIGTPVWGFSPAPAVNTYLDKCIGLEDKKIVLFCTVGGIGQGKCLKNMQALLSPKSGNAEIKVFYLRKDEIKEENKAQIFGKIQSALD
jgi:flavodoxin